MRQSLRDIRQETIDQIRDYYENSVRLSKLGLEAINLIREPSERYCSIEEYIRELLSTADTLAYFAVCLGLLSKVDAGQIADDFYSQNLELSRAELGGVSLISELAGCSDMYVLKTSLRALRRAALEKVRERYEETIRLRKLSLEQINGARPPSRQYCSMKEFVRELKAGSAEVSSFAVNLGLISPEQAMQIINDVGDTHAEFLMKELME